MRRDDANTERALNTPPDAHGFLALTFGRSVQSPACRSLASSVSPVGKSRASRISPQRASPRADKVIDPVPFRTHHRAGHDFTTKPDPDGSAVGRSPSKSSKDVVGQTGSWFDMATRIGKPNREAKLRRVSGDGTLPSQMGSAAAARIDHVHDRGGCSHCFPHGSGDHELNHSQAGAQLEKKPKDCVPKVGAMMLSNTPMHLTTCGRR